MAYRMQQDYPTWESPHPESSFLGSLALWAMLACIINCALPEIQMLLTGGSVPLPQAIVKTACFSFLIALLMLYRTLDLSSFPTTIWFVAMGYLVLAFPYLWFAQYKQPAEILLAYNAYYCPLIFAPVATALRGKVSERTVLRIFLATFMVCALLGWAQFILQDTVVPMVSDDGNFKIMASNWQEAGESLVLRASSFFGSAQEYGSFAVLMAAVGIAMCRERHSWKRGVLLYLAAAATCYTTLTRVVYLQFVVATIVALILTFGRKPKRAAWQPLVALGLGWMIAFSGIAALFSQGSGLSNSASLEMRVQQWAMYASNFFHASIWQQLFGFGFCQADKPLMIARQAGGASVLVDNIYLALTLHIGVVGMLLITALLWAMWRSLRLDAVLRPTPVLIGIASFYATFAMTGMFNVQPANYGFWFLIGTIVSRRGGEVVEEELEWSSDVAPALGRG